MISETLPLNEWPSEYLKVLWFDLTNTHRITPITRELIEVVSMAIKDAEEREAKLPF